MSHPFVQSDTPIAFAHRGGASDAPENTMPAFQRAMDLGYRYIETDVHATKDGVLLAFHDDDLMRTCGQPGVISEMTYDEVKTFRINGQEPIPLMQEIFDAWPNAMVGALVADQSETGRRIPRDSPGKPDPVLSPIPNLDR